MKRLAFVAAAVAMLLAAGSKANAAGITIKDLGIVGTSEGLAGDNPGVLAESVPMAQAILDLAQGATGTFVNGAGSHPIKANPKYEYGGTIDAVGALHFDTDHPFHAPEGFTYALAKYDGKNAGFVLFYLPDWGSTTLPEYSYSIWGKTAAQYQISGFWVFNPIETKTVPDGSSTAALLGSVLVGFALVRRRFQSR